jgi:hypothetical protein
MANFIKNRVVNVLFFCGLLALFNGATVADTFVYQINGHVTDNTGTNIGGAKVAATRDNIELGAATSGDDGSFNLRFETTKEYNGGEMVFIVTREGFHRKSVPNVPLQAGKPLIVNFKLERDLKAFKPDKDAERYRTYEFFELIEMNRY